MLRATHYAGVRCASRAAPIPLAILKTSVSLLRYTDVVHADRAYYEAGVEARNAGLQSEAFVFLNHFLDFEECVGESDVSVLGKRYLLFPFF